MAPPRKRRSYLIRVENDGLVCNEIGPWAEDKYRHMGMYAEIFSTAMRQGWDTRVYLDLFAGPGYSRLRGTDRFYLGSPLIALSVPHQFDRYISSEESAEAMASLRARVTRDWPSADVRFVEDDANSSVEEAIAHIPGTGRVLSFCFLDPYKLNVSFETVQRLAEGRRIDFLILLALYVDANRNVDLYVRDERTTIDRFLGDRAWRARWNVAKKKNAPFVPLLAEEYSRRMEALGYLPMRLDHMVKVRTHERRIPLYYLAFYTRDPRGLAFWEEVRRYSKDQLDLPLIGEDNG